MSRHLHARLILALTAVLGPTLLRAASFRAEAAASWVENIGRSSSPVDWRDTLVAEVSGTGTWSRQLAPSLTGSLEADLGVSSAPRFERLSFARTGVEARATRKFGLGPLAPVVSAAVAAGGKLARMAEDTGFTTSATLQASKRFTEAWQLGAGVEWMRHNADSAVFDVSHRKVWGELKWDLTERWRLTYGYGRLRGNFTANAGPVIWSRALGGQLSAAIARYYNTVPWAVTDSLGDGWVTYNVTGQSRFWWLELSPALSDTTSLSLRYDSVFTKNIIFVKYRQDIWTLSLNQRF
jgi:hypothetical protein